MAEDRPLLFPDLPVHAPALSHAEKLLLRALPDLEPAHRYAAVNAEDQAACKKLLRRGLIAIAPYSTQKPPLRAARLPHAMQALRTQ